jgi:hypothetical protein
MDQQLLNEMFAEHYYLSGGSTQRDEHGEFEWIEMPTIDGTKRVKKYIDKIDI